MGLRLNQLNVYLLVAALILGNATGYILGIKTNPSMTKMNQLESEIASLREEFNAYSGRDWRLAFNYGESFGPDPPGQVIRNSLGPFHLEGNEVRFVWLFQSQKLDDGVPGTLEITLRYANGTSVGRRTTSSVFSIGSADMDLRAEGNYTIGFMATGCVDTFIWVWDYG
jgi:hypothetical protein